MERIGPDILGRLFDEHAALWCFLRGNGATRRKTSSRTRLRALARQKTVPERVVPWLYRVVRNGAISASRQSRRRRRREERAADLETAPGDPWFAATDDRIDAELASRLLADLDGETREVIVGRLWGGLTFEEIAQLTGLFAEHGPPTLPGRARPAACEARTPMDIEHPRPRPRTRPERSGTTAGGLAAGGWRSRPRPDALRRRPSRRAG